MARLTKTYLGDAVYAEFNGFDVELTTEDGISATNRIVLEPEVLRELLAYMARTEGLAEILEKAVEGMR
jgi:hypothetical protein